MLVSRAQSKVRQVRPLTRRTQAASVRATSDESSRRTAGSRAVGARRSESLIVVAGRCICPRPDASSSCVRPLKKDRPIMCNKLLALFIASTLSPTMAFAQSEGATCNLVDQKALVALKLGEHKITVKRKEGPKTSHVPTQVTDTCTISPRDAGLPSLIITTAVLPPSTPKSTQKAFRPSCSSSPLPRMTLYKCTTVERNTFVILTLLTKGSPDVAMEGTFRSQVERLFGGQAGENSKGAAVP